MAVVVPSPERRDSRLGAPGDLVHELLDRRQVRMVFQPLVHLASREVVGFEALARGPHGSRLEGPGALFAEADRVGRRNELDWVCRAEACRIALSAGLPPSISWFLNVEPSALGSQCPQDLRGVLAEAGMLRIVMEYAEREIAADPARLLAAARATQSQSWGVALDDVGADPQSLAMLPFVQPDVVKLDMSLLDRANPAHAAAVSNAVRAYAEETEAVILAEGVETADHERAARVMGAVYGQGWYYGRPGGLPAQLPDPTAAFPLRQSVAEETATPFSIATSKLTVDRSTKELLLPMSKHLEYQALRGGESYVLLGAFQHSRHYTATTRARFERLSRANTFTAALAADLPPMSKDVATVNLEPDDPLVDEWNVVVVGPHFAGALLARDCGDGAQAGDMHRRFDYAITHERSLVLRAARSMLQRITL